MRKLLAPLVLALLLVAAPAHAALFTLASYSVSLHTDDPGLVLFEDNLLGTPTSFTLNSVGDSATATLFRIGTKETALNADDLIPYTISVGFNFSTPSPGFGGTAAGITGAGWFLGSYGYVAWDNPLVMAFGTTGLLGVTLENATFGMPGSTNIDAKFQLLRKDTGSTKVPEPTSGLLLGVGVAAMAVTRRRRFLVHP